MIKCMKILSHDCCAFVEVHRVTERRKEYVYKTEPTGLDLRVSDIGFLSPDFIATSFSTSRTNTRKPITVRVTDVDNFHNGSYLTLLHEE